MLDLVHGLVLLSEAILIHLVEIHIRHQSVTLIAHSVLLFVHFAESSLRGGGAQGADTAATTPAVMLLLVLRHVDHTGDFSGEGDATQLAHV